VATTVSKGVAVVGFALTVQRPEEGVVEVALRGSLDLAHAYRFDGAIRPLEREATRCLVLDLRELDFLDSTGLARLVGARRRARRAGRRLVLVRGSRTIQRLFSLVALEEHFAFVGSPSEVHCPSPVAASASRLRDGAG
jgi:anti-anti-sigma factor